MFFVTAMEGACAGLMRLAVRIKKLTEEEHHEKCVW
jgi:hypothetical protein